MTRTSPPLETSSFDDDGRPKRTGTVLTTSSHIITAVIGTGVLSLAWATAQLGWIAGPSTLLLFSIITYYTSTLLATAYRTGDPNTGKRNYTYPNAVRSILGGVQVKFCGLIQYIELFGATIGYTIASGISMRAIKKTHCFHDSGGKTACDDTSSTPYMLIFGAIQLFLSQIPDFDQISWLSIVAAIMSFTYSIIGLSLGIAKVAETGVIRGNLTGIRIGTVTEMQKMWRCFQALGNIAFAYSYALILIEIQDTIKSPPSEAKTMQKASLISVSATTVFYMLCGCFGYAAFGDLAPGNLITGVGKIGFHNPYWLIDIANVAIVVHLVGAYQVYSQPLFAFMEKIAANRFPSITKEYKVPIPGLRPYNLNLFRLIWRTIFVMITTIISIAMPFFNDIIGILGAIGFWPLTVYFPIEMFIVQMKIPKWSTRWVCLRILSGCCLIISLVAVVGSVVGVVQDYKTFKPFKG
ncbi:amino acid permease 3-like [Impatiens glandulifera]|uniref:amino acid permease 3-like n=1 Tax=Impatiens glandulifera TaxID=253017 RepID=UPI001FB094CE|nr:amino acid permease 3-like [Impatiens glandulifera]